MSLCPCVAWSGIARGNGANTACSPMPLASTPHEIDHVVAEKHNGQTAAHNLCLSCWVCNRHKGSDLTSLDPQTGAITPLFHPRQDRWEDHFRLIGTGIAGITPQGRTTVRMLHFNDPDQLELRALLMALGRYP